MNTSTQKLQPRDIIIALLCVAVLCTNWIWYQSSQDLSKRLDPVNTNDYKQFVQIQELKACVDKNIRPCDLP